MYRRGIVVAIDPATARVRCQFPERDGLVSWWLDVLQDRTLGDRTYWMPDIGEYVGCMMDEHDEAGAVVGSVFSSADPPPVTDPDKRHRVHKDGAVFEYDRKLHRWYVYVPGDIEVIANGNVTATVGGAVALDAQGDIDVTSATRVSVKAPVVAISGASGGAQTSLEGDFTLVGSLHVDGDITATGTIIDQGGNTPNHSH